MHDPKSLDLRQPSPTSTRGRALRRLKGPILCLISKLVWLWRHISPIYWMAGLKELSQVLRGHFSSNGPPRLRNSSQAWEGPSEFCFGTLLGPSDHITRP